MPRRRRAPWDARAVLFAELRRNRIQRIPVDEIEAYSIDTALDTDADSFSIEIGDPGADLTRLLGRDNEVRANLFAGMSGNVEELQRGFADSVGFTEEGTLVVQGRDNSCLATDTVAPPHSYTHYRPHDAIRKEAHRLGFREFRLDKVPAISNFYTDGSETVWEKWYRAYRKRGRWMWMEPNGILRADVLHYTHEPRYRFGTPRRSRDRAHWIPVESVEFTTRKQGRIGTAMVIGEGRNIGLVVRVKDRTISNWTRKPLQIFSETDLNSRKEARKQAFEEIFESKVGAVEIIITVSHPGFVIRQNRMARLRIPQMGIDGNYFVVGNTIIGGTEGVVQRIRLRQKGFAISRRVPDDPELDLKHPGKGVAGAMGSALGERWGEAFVAAAREFHKPWPFDLFCATLLAICRKETGFRNVRYAGTTEWYPPPGTGSAQTPQAGASIATALRRHHRLFANSINNPLNPLYGRSEAAVGPMQLVTPTFKVWADQYGGRRGEYNGGRWIPEANIKAAARALRAKLQGLTVSEANMFYACGFRYYGSGSSAANQAYAQDIRRFVMSDPGYLGIVREAQEAGREALHTSAGGAWGGSKAIADQFRKVAEANGLNMISAKRSTRNTTSGNMSDHYTGCKQCYAYDLSDGSRPTPAMDKTARDLVRMTGGSYNGRSELVYSKVIDGFRIQILYRTYVGGNHFNHVHVGVRRV